MEVFLKHKSEHIVFLQGLPAAIRVRFQPLSCPQRFNVTWNSPCSSPPLFPFLFILVTVASSLSVGTQTYSRLRDFSQVISSTWQDLSPDCPRDQGSGWQKPPWGPELVNLPLHPGCPSPCSGHLLTFHYLIRVLLISWFMWVLSGFLTQNIRFMRSGLRQSCWLLSSRNPELFLHKIGSSEWLLKELLAECLPRI